MSNAMNRPLWRGRTNVDQMTIDAIEDAERLAGFQFVVTQGSYQSSVAASAGTHDRGGVVDLRARSMSTDKQSRMVDATRPVGFADWPRNPSPEPDVHHRPA